MFFIEEDRLVCCGEMETEQIAVSQGVTTIGAHAFERHSRVRGITLPPSVKTIGDAAFADCAALVSVRLEDGLKRLGNGCFQNCVSLRQIHLPDTVASIHPQAFQGCVRLADVHLSAGLRRNIESRTFGGCIALERIAIPHGVQRIKSGAFDGCTALRTVIFENPDVQIERGAFSGCSRLDEQTLTFIETHTFQTGAIDIRSRASGAIGRLSNYTERRFVFDGIPCASLEGVLQSFKCPDPIRQTEICALTGGWAKQAGGRYDWKKEQLLHWQGQAYPRRSEAYQQLLDRLYDAVYDQDEGFRRDLSEIRGKNIDHRMGLSNPAETVLTRHEFVFRLQRLSERTGLQV